MVQQAQQPTITIIGKHLVDARVADLKAGHRVFKDIDIKVNMKVQGDFVNEILDVNLDDSYFNVKQKSKAFKMQEKLEKKLLLRKYG